MAWDPLLTGRRIAERRRAMGLTQEELAARLGISAQQVSEHERGRRRIPGPRLAEIARVLNTSVAYLVGETDDPSPLAKTPDTPPARSGRLSPAQQLRELGAMLRGAGATEEDVRIIMELLERRRRLREQAEGGDEKPQ